MAEVRDIRDVEEFKSSIKNAAGSLSVVHFSASWAPQCGQMHDVITELAKDPEYSSVNFLKLEAEDLPEISEQFEISAVPTFIYIRNEKQVDRVDGANAAEITKKVKTLLSQSNVTVPDLPKPQKQDINTRLKNLIKAAEVMLFMKGTPAEPKCGFSKQLIEILKDANIKYSTFNILEDDEVRQGLKSYSNWPTYPQLYAKGELLGGLDIIKELAETGELTSQLPQQQTLDERLKALTNKSPVMLFMKGDRHTPRCGFSKQTIAILNESGIEYQTFDILTDDEVRQGLKTFSNWPTYPQLYVKGELIGGLDIIKELQESDELVNILKEGQ